MQKNCIQIQTSKLLKLNSNKIKKILPLFSIIRTAITVKFRKNIKLVLNVEVFKRFW